MDPQELSKRLAALAAYDEQEAVEEYPPPELPEGAPNLARMYTAILREDWTPTERDLVKNDPQVLRMYRNTLDNVWFPTNRELWQYAKGELSGELQQDVKHHLEVDKCRSSLRIFGWFNTVACVGRGVAEGIRSVAEDFERVIDTISTSLRPLELPPAMGFASGDDEPTTLIEDDRIRVIHDPQTDQLRLSSQFLSEGALMRVVMIADDGQVWQRFALLWDKFRDQVMGRCEAPRPDDLDTESREHNSIVCFPVDISTLTEQDTADLGQSWTWSKENQASSIDAWTVLASELKQKSTVDSLKAVAEEIG